MNREIEYKRLSEEISNNPPRFKIGDIVIVQSEDVQKAIQGKIKVAEFFKEWFYGIEVQGEMIYTYEKDTGDAKTKIIKIAYKLK